MNAVRNLVVGAMALAISAAAAPAFAGSMTVKFTNNTTATVNITGGATGSVAPGATGQTTINTTNGLPQQNVFTVKNAANTKSCSFSYSRTGQQTTGGPLCGTTLGQSALWLVPGTNCTATPSNIVQSPTCTGTITFTIQ